MPVLIQQDLNGVTQEMYEAVDARLGADTNPPAGLILHTAGPVDDGWRILDVWESVEDYQRFGEDRVGPAVEAVAKEAGFEPQRPDTTVRELYRVTRP